MLSLSWSWWFRRRRIRFHAWHFIESCQGFGTPLSLICFSNLLLCTSHDFLRLWIILFCLKLCDSFCRLDNTKEGPNIWNWLCSAADRCEHKVLSCSDHIVQSVAPCWVEQFSVFKSNVMVLRCMEEDFLIAMDSFWVVLLAQIYLCQLIPRFRIFHVYLNKLVQYCDCFIIPVHVSVHGNKTLYRLLILGVLFNQVEQNVLGFV